MKHYTLRRSRKPKSRNNRRQRTYRYRGGAAGGPVGAAAQIAAVDAAFNAAMGSTVIVIKKATAQASHGSCKEAKDRAFSLMGRLSPYDPNTVVTAAMLAADLATTTATSQAARSDYLARHVLGPQPNIFDTPIDHSLADSKSQPVKKTSPKCSH
jgi:hypothetical protein